MLTCFDAIPETKFGDTDFHVEPMQYEDHKE